MNPLLALTPRRRLVVGHRGNAAFAPENTLESFQQAVSLGADGIEFDVHLTRDGRAVVMHDPTLDRTTNASGAIAELTLAEIQRADAGAKFTPDGGRTFPYAGTGVRAPTFEDVLASFLSLPMIVELKTPRVSAEVLRLIKAHRAEERCIASSFVDRALDPFAGSGIPIAASPEQLRALFLPGYLRRRVRSVPFQCISAPRFDGLKPLPLVGWVRILEPLGVPVHVWTIDQPAMAERLWAKGVRGVLTNDPATLRRAAGA